MISPVLYALDNNMDTTAFERLCSILLYRNGHTNVNPIGGPHDGGRDAESAAEGKVYQYSVEKTWEQKLKKELVKASGMPHSVTEFVFVTTGKVTGRKRDTLKKDVQAKHGFQLEIFDREWLCMQLEGQHHDLAINYLGIKPEMLKEFFRHSPLFVAPPARVSQSGPWNAYLRQDFELAVLLFQRDTKADSDVSSNRKAMAHCLYELRRYKDALECLALTDPGEQATAWGQRLRANILIESASETKSREMLVAARRILEGIVQSSTTWQDHFNHGTCLSSLLEVDAAITAFKRALDFDRTRPEIWKNLGTAYSDAKMHDAEIAAYKEALRLDPKRSEAWASWGVTEILVFTKHESGIEKLRRAEQCDPRIGVTWANYYYWLARGLDAVGRSAEALDVVETGLSLHPAHADLINAKGTILKDLWQTAGHFRQVALTFFQERLEVHVHDSAAAAELARIYAAAPDAGSALRVLSKALSVDESELPIDNVDHWICVAENQPYYRGFRQKCPVARYAGMLEHRVIGLRVDWRSFELRAASAFVLGQAALADGLVAGNAATSIALAFEAARPALELAMYELARHVGLAYSNSTVELKTSVLAELVLILPEIGLREATAQMGTLSGAAGIPNEVATDASGDAAVDIGRGYILQVVRGFNVATRLLPDD